MEGALDKTLMLLFFLLIGFIIRKKFKSKEQVNGIKNMILTIALPATIFVALMGVEIEASMLVYPALALLFNLVLYVLTPTLLRAFGVRVNSKEGRTLRLLIPSLAPGLSCFPFIIEFLGETELAIAALADLGNKVFVLLVLYLIAMNLFLANNHKLGDAGKNEKLKSLLLSLVKEPINMVIFAAITFISFGVQLTDLPGFLSNAFQRMGGMMTPLILIFIGLAVTVKRKRLLPIFTLLISRAGLSMLIVGIMCMILGVKNSNTMLLGLAFALSSCSFWPFAHMASFDQKEERPTSKGKTFDLNYGLLVLAISLPVSSILILTVLNSGKALASNTSVIIMGVSLILLALVPQLIRRVKLLIRIASKAKITAALETAD